MRYLNFEPYRGIYIYIVSDWWFQIFFIFTPILGEMIQFDNHIFQMGWFKHQLDIFVPEALEI